MRLNASFKVVPPQRGEAITVTLSAEVGHSWQDQQRVQEWLCQQAGKLEAEFKNGERSYP